MDEVITARQCFSEGKTSTALQGLLNILFSVITAVTLVGALWEISPPGALVAVCAAFPVLMTYAWYGKQESRVWPTAARHSRRAAYFDEQLAHPRNAVELASTGGGRVFADASKESRRLATTVRDRLENLSVVSDSAAGLGSSVFLLIALVLFWQGGKGTAVDMAAGIVGIVSGMGAMSGLGYQVGELATSIPAVGRFRRFLGDDSHSQAISVGIPSNARRVVQAVAQDLAVAYPSHRELTVSGVNLRVRCGHMVAIVGGNGAGKTTLVRALSGVLPPAQGSCTLTMDNGDVVAPGPDTVAFLGQDYGRYELTIREYLSLGMNHVPHDVALWEALTRVRLDGHVRKLPSQLDNQLGSSWGGVDLSGGQWQRLAIARLFLLDRPMWILDEPTSSIDAEVEVEIFDLLQAECRDRCIIVVTHRASTLTHMDDIVVMDQGRIVQRGTFDQLVHRDGRLREMFRGQLEEVRRLVGIDPTSQSMPSGTAQ